MGAHLQDGLRNLRCLLRRLQHAPREDLMKIPGLGPRKVDRILKWRAGVGGGSGMTSISDLVSVPGMGVQLLANIGGGDAFLPSALKFIVYYQEVVGSVGLKHPRDVVSVDLGVRNSACVHVTSDLRVRDWRRLSLRMPVPYSPHRCYQEVVKTLEELPDAEAYIMEVASQRAMMQMKGFLNISVQLKSLEAMFYAVLKTVRKGPVLTIQPRMTSQYFDISYLRWRAKKKAAVSLVNDLISDREVDGQVLTPLGNRLHFPEELIRYFDEEKKQDDLSDCLLQAVAFMEWNQLARGLW